MTARKEAKVLAIGADHDAGTAIGFSPEGAGKTFRSGEIAATLDGLKLHAMNKTKTNKAADGSSCTVLWNKI